MEALYRRGIPWNRLEELQQELVGKVAQDPREIFLLVSEPTPTFTYGHSSKPSELLWPHPCQRGVQVAPAQRGGRWTYHGPGQVVVYPIAFLPRLGYPKRAIKAFLGDLASSVVSFLSTLGLSGEIRLNPYGVYVSKGKIAAFGVSVRNGICSHGLSVYLTPQKEFFGGIVPCGSPDLSITCLEEMGVVIGWRTAAQGLTEHIKRGFQASKN